MLLQISQLSGEAAQAVQGASQAATPPQTSLSLLELLMKGGLLMIPIVLLSLLSIALIIERWLYIRSRSRGAKNLGQSVRDFVYQGDIKAAKSACQNSNSAVSVVLEKGVSKVGKPIREIENAMEKTASIELMKMEKNLGFLGIIAGIAPMLGFIGTISGVIKIFYNISVTDNISIGIIAGGLYEKMITSGAGLIVGVISYAGYHYLNLLMDRITLKIESEANDFLDFLQQ